MKRALLCFLAIGFAGIAFTQSPAILKVEGDVPAPLQLTAADLATMPRQSVSVKDQKGAAIEYEGVAARDVLAKAGAPLGKELRRNALATYVLAEARDGYEVLFAIAEFDAQFANESIVIADKRDGKPLSPNDGPLRLVCPADKEGARSVRMLESLEVVRLRK